MNIEKEFEDFKEIIEKGGIQAREYFFSDANPATQKEDGTLVTKIDKNIESMLRQHISERFSNDTIVGEEDDTVWGDSGFVWLIDPIDGTDNFVRKIPFFAITATRLGPGPEDSFSIIHNPVSRQTFASLMEDGSYENDNLSNLTADPIGSKFYITVSGASSYANWIKPARSALQLALAQKFGKSGHYQSSLLEFAYVSSGRLDGFLDIEMPPWDTAAGLYLVKSAGGAISIYNDGEWQRYTGAIKDLYGTNFDKRITVFVSHPDIHQEVLKLIDNPKEWADK